MHEGHRMRMIEKLEKNAEVLAEHELLEILLFNAKPRVNTNTTAHLLIKRFGDIQGVLTADMEDLKRVEGVGQQVAAYLKLVGMFCQKFQMKEELALPNMYHYKSFHKYIEDRFSPLDYELLELYFIAKDGKSIF